LTSNSENQRSLASNDALGSQAGAGVWGRLAMFGVLGRIRTIAVIQAKNRRQQENHLPFVI